MKRPLYNRKPVGKWRDSGDRRELLPEIDPNWKRRPSQRPDRDGVGLPILITCAVLAGVWVLKYRHGQEAAFAPPARPSVAVPDARMQAMADQQARANQAWPAAQGTIMQDAPLPGLPSINGKTLHRCVYQGYESIQATPCAAPYVELRQGEGSRWQRVQEQEQMRLAAEAKLELERRRFEAAARLEGQQAWVTGNTSVSRCDRAKAERDAAYRAAGNNRKFDFIRRWNDYVFEACKS